MVSTLAQAKREEEALVGVGGRSAARMAIGARGGAIFDY